MKKQPAGSPKRTPQAILSLKSVVFHAWNTWNTKNPIILIIPRKKCEYIKICIIYREIGICCSKCSRVPNSAVDSARKAKK
jgi:hypothetical protein